MLGALVCLADMVQVFSLNMTYDVPVKLFAVPPYPTVAAIADTGYPGRLTSFLLLNRAVGPSTQPQLFRTQRANRAAVGVQVVFGLSLIALNAYGAWKAWHTFGGGRERSALYGIWNVEGLSTNSTAGAA